MGIERISRELPHKSVVKDYADFIRPTSVFCRSQTRLRLNCLFRNPHTFRPMEVHKNPRKLMQFLPKAGRETLGEKLSKFLLKNRKENDE